MNITDSSAAPVAACGLYCGACGQFIAGRCKGCAENAKAAWCKIRSCCKERAYATCAQCHEYGSVKECKKFNNIVSKIFGLIFGSDRPACIERIKAVGVELYATEMAQQKRPSIKRGR